jgi:hypothetical protein
MMSDELNRGKALSDLPHIQERPLHIEVRIPDQNDIHNLPRFIHRYGHATVGIPSVRAASQSDHVA